MQRRYVTVDVFTDRVFGGNPLAVVLDAEGLSAGQMQSIATEFNYSETAFVLPPVHAHHTAHVRIFTSRIEVPFAGHPNVGTAYVLAHERALRDGAPLEECLFEEAAGLVQVRLLRDLGQVVGAEFAAPRPLSVQAHAAIADVACCLRLACEDVTTNVHPPQVLSVGLPFLVVELATRDALRRARPDVAAHERLLPALGTDAVYAYVRGGRGGELEARMFSPIDACVEDAATGSATAATIAHLAQHSQGATGERRWRITQGVDMGRPSMLLGRTVTVDGRVTSVHVGGHVVEVMRGHLKL